MAGKVYAIDTGRSEVAVFSRYADEKRGDSFFVPVETNALTGTTQLVPARRLPISINLADRQRGQPRPAGLGR